MSYKLGNELKRLRKIKGVSLRDVERETGISNAYLSQLERGDAKNPSLQKLAKLARYYQVSSEVLINIAGSLNLSEESPITRNLVASAKASENNKSNKTSMLHSALLNANLSEEDEELVAEYVAFLSSRKHEKRA